MREGTVAPPLWQYPIIIDKKRCPKTHLMVIGYFWNAQTNITFWNSLVLKYPENPKSFFLHYLEKNPMDLFLLLQCSHAF